MWARMRAGYREQGFSSHAANFLALPAQFSTPEVYDRKWAISCTWCTEMQIDPVSVHVLAEFLLNLYYFVGLAACTDLAYE